MRHLLRYYLPSKVSVKAGLAHSDPFLRQPDVSFSVDKGEVLAFLRKWSRDRRTSDPYIPYPLAGEGEGEGVVCVGSNGKWTLTLLISLLSLVAAPVAATAVAEVSVGRHKGPWNLQYVGGPHRSLAPNPQSAE